MEIVQAGIGGLGLHQGDQVLDGGCVLFGEAFEIDEIAVETEISAQGDQLARHLGPRQIAAVEEALVRLEQGAEAARAIAVGGVSQGRIGHQARRVPADNDVLILPGALDMDAIGRRRRIARAVEIDVGIIERQIGGDQCAGRHIGIEPGMRLGGGQRCDALGPAHAGPIKGRVGIGGGIVNLEDVPGLAAGQRIGGQNRRSRLGQAAAGGQAGGSRDGCGCGQEMPAAEGHRVITPIAPKTMMGLSCTARARRRRR